MMAPQEHHCHTAQRLTFWAFSLLHHRLAYLLLKTGKLIKKLFFFQLELLKQTSLLCVVIIIENVQTVLQNHIGGEKIPVVVSLLTPAGKYSQSPLFWRSQWSSMFLLMLIFEAITPSASRGRYGHSNEKPLLPFLTHSGSWQKNHSAVQGCGFPPAIPLPKADYF